MLTSCISGSILTQVIGSAQLACLTRRVGRASLVNGGDIRSIDGNLFPSEHVLGNCGFLGESNGPGIARCVKPDSLAVLYLPLNSRHRSALLNSSGQTDLRFPNHSVQESNQRCPCQQCGEQEIVIIDEHPCRDPTQNNSGETVAGAK